MTTRVRFDRDGLRISRPGVDVDAAGIADLTFRAQDGAVPVVLRGTVQLATSWSTVVSIGYGRDFGRPPPSTLLYSVDHPSIATDFVVISAMSTYGYFTAGQTGVSSDGDVQYLYWDRRSDRIDLWQKRNHTSGAEASLLAGWVSALVYDYGSLF